MAFPVMRIARTRYCWYLAANDAHSVAGILCTSEDDISVTGIAVPPPVVKVLPGVVILLTIWSPALSMENALLVF
jgi:hypothetical protein